MSRQRTLARLERFGSLGSALLVGGIAYRHLTASEFLKIDEVLAAVLNLAAIFSGFIGTMGSILLSLVGRRSMSLIVGSGNGTPLMKYLERAFLSMLSLAFTSGVGMSHDWKNKEPSGWWDLWFAIWIGVGVLALGQFLRLFLTFSALLRYEIGTSSGPGGK